MRTSLSLIILFISKTVRLEDTAEISEFEESTTSIYDVIINERDREIDDIAINEIDNASEDDVDDDEGERDTEGQRVGEDAHKLLAAQVNAVHVLNMIKDLEEDMKVSFNIRNLFQLQND